MLVRHCRGGHVAMSSLNLATAFIAGLVSFLSPCVLPLIPGYVCFVSGVSLQDLQVSGPNPVSVRRAFVSTVWFVLGFSAVFIVLGASATTLGALLLRKLALFRWVAGAVIMLFGIHLTGLVRIPFLQVEKKFEVRSRPLTQAGAFLVGAAFAFGWTPCIGPILAGILALASTQETIGRGMLLLAVYSAGLGLPFLATSLGIGVFLRVFARFKRYLRAVEIASGILLLLIGLLIMTDRLSAFTQSVPFFNRFSL